MWHAHNANGLHAVQIVDNSQAMKTKSTTRKMVDILKAKAIGSAMSYFKAARNLFVDIRLRAEYTPNAAHFKYLDLEVVLKIKYDYFIEFTYFDKILKSKNGFFFFSEKYLSKCGINCEGFYM